MRKKQKSKEAHRADSLELNFLICRFRELERSHEDENKTVYSRERKMMYSVNAMRYGQRRLV